MLASLCALVLAAAPVSQLTPNELVMEQAELSVEPTLTGPVVALVGSTALFGGGVAFAKLASEGGLFVSANVVASVVTLAGSLALGVLGTLTLHRRVVTRAELRERRSEVEARLATVDPSRMHLTGPQRARLSDALDDARPSFALPLGLMGAGAMAVGSTVFTGMWNGGLQLDWAKYGVPITIGAVGLAVMGVGLALFVGVATEHSEISQRIEAVEALPVKARELQRYQEQVPAPPTWVSYSVSF